MEHTNNQKHMEESGVAMAKHHMTSEHSEKRLPVEAIKVQREAIFKISFKEYMDKSPQLMLILNAYQQIIYANPAFLHYVHVQQMDDLLGKKTGQVFHCTHAEDNNLGCGIGSACRMCKLSKTVLKSAESKQTVSGDVQIPTQVQENIGSVNLDVFSMQFRVDEETFFILTMRDNSDELRGKEMERIFYHDMINSVGALFGFTRLLKAGVDERTKTDIEFIEDILKSLFEDVRFHKEMFEAENHTLKVTKNKISAMETMDYVIRLLDNLAAENNKEIEIAKDAVEVMFQSDAKLLQRILLNMLKNAIEDSQHDSTVSIGSYIVMEDHKKKVEFRVTNEGKIPKDIQLQIFKRSFSTKEEGRGLGTYSMKIFGENYLGGKVGFHSGFVEEKNRNETTFYIRLDL